MACHRCLETEGQVWEQVCVNGDSGVAMLTEGWYTRGCLRGRDVWREKSRTAARA